MNFLRPLLLLSVMFLLSCSVPNLTHKEITKTNCEETDECESVHSLIIKNEKGLRVFSGKANVYKDKITYDLTTGGVRQIPNEDIYQVYRIYRGGGTVTFLATAVSWFAYGSYFFSKPENDENLAAGLGYLVLGVYLAPSSMIAGTVFGNFRVLLYQRSENSELELDYLVTAENAPKSRRDARMKHRK